MLKSAICMKTEEIKNYIEENYSIQCENHIDCFGNQELLMKDKKYDVTIQVEKPSENHYLHGKCEYVIDCNYNANKKYQAELCYHGGGYSCEYSFENIDEFLSEWFKKNSERQLTIFDFLESEVN